MLKYAVASAVLILGLAASASPVLAAPRNDGCVNCSPAKQYANDDVVRPARDIDRTPVVDTNTNTPAPAGESAEYPNRAGIKPGSDCVDCPPPKKYDSIEVIKSSRDVDQSRVIDTDEVVQARPRVKEINKLIIHENEIRNVGVIQHNHRIIEKETRYRRAPAPVYRRAVPQYQVVLVPVAAQRGCACSCCSGYTYGTGYVYDARYATVASRGGERYAPERYSSERYGSEQWVPVAEYGRYGYR